MKRKIQILADMKGEEAGVAKGVAIMAAGEAEAEDRITKGEMSSITLKKRDKPMERASLRSPGNSLTQAKSKGRSSSKLSPRRRSGLTCTEF